VIDDKILNWWDLVEVRPTVDITQRDILFAVEREVMVTRTVSQEGPRWKP
jgi:hypothetical protein